MTAELAVLKASDFETYMHQHLSIQFTSNESLPAEVIEVKETNNYIAAERTPFFIVFRTSQKDRYYQQGIYNVEHPEKGAMPIFLVPIGPDGKGMRYEAVFS